LTSAALQADARRFIWQAMTVNGPVGGVRHHTCSGIDNGVAVPVNFRDHQHGCDLGEHVVEHISYREHPVATHLEA